MRLRILSSQVSTTWGHMVPDGETRLTNDSNIDWEPPQSEAEAWRQLLSSGAEWGEDERASCPLRWE